MMFDSVTPLSTSEVIEAIRHWLEQAVIGLNLCPFAKAVHVKGQIRYVVSSARTVQELERDLVVELQALQATNSEETDTTLLIHPWVLTDFLDYNDFLDIADDTIDGLKLRGEIQIASFHPHYQFAGTEPDDIDNYTNRAPHPILHLLREASIDRAVAAYPETEEIFQRNIQTLRRLGHHGWNLLGITDTTRSDPDK